MASIITVQTSEIDFLEEHPRKWGWLLALSIVMMLGGLLGFVATFAYTIAGVVAFSVLLSTSGIFQLLHEFFIREHKWVGTASHLALGVLYLLLGGAIACRPIEASVVLTAFIAGAFAAMSVFRFREAWLRRKSGWLWTPAFVSGLLEVACALLIIVQWPSSAVWVIGFIIALELLLNGSLLLLAALLARRLEKTL